MNSTSRTRNIVIQHLMDTSGARGQVVDMTKEVSFAYTTAFLKAISVSSGRVALAIDLRPSR